MPVVDLTRCNGLVASSTGMSYRVLSVDDDGDRVVLEGPNGLRYVDRDELDEAIANGKVWVRS